MKERLIKFGLSVNQEKTQLLEFVKYADESRFRKGFKKPETFEFLGFTHICGKTVKGKFTVIRRLVKKRMREKVLKIKSALRKRMHRKIPETGEWLKSVLVGYYRYYGVSGNLGALEQFRFSDSQKLASRTQAPKSTTEISKARVMTIIENMFD